MADNGRQYSNNVKSRWRYNFAHGDLRTQNDIHIAHQWEYDDAIERIGDTGFSSDDLYKLALQLDDFSLWMLINILPDTTPIWKAVGDGGGGGGGGGSDANYIHVQSTPSSSWTIVHNLGKYPSVDVLDSAGSEVVGDLTYNSINSVTLTFSAPFSGTATLN